MRSLLLILLVLPLGAFAQQAARALEKSEVDLKERYLLMKNNSQTYEDYKVIKEFILDGFWKIAVDTIKAKENALAEANNQIKTLQQQINEMQQQMVQQQASVEGIRFDSEHISVLGVHFGKNIFLLLTAGITGALIFLLLVVSGRLKILQASIKEKAQVVEAVTHEFDDYKRKALERQTKLSRELQNERNKLVELGRS
ncbi:MAG: hypothetical protein J0L66_12475 [Cytophagales bacterium]|nr:hypothetical protein [Cytophagales bacterium]